MNDGAKMRLAVPTGGEGLLSSPSAVPRSAAVSPIQYLHRLADLKQMDMQSAVDQMKQLLGTQPQSVYKMSYYRKQTKSHWSRDDPAFVALQVVFLGLAAVAYAVAFQTTFMGFVSFLLYTILNFLGMGWVLATLCREIANRHLVVHQSSTHVRQQVEWMYAFDIHCNSFFPVFMVLYVLQFFLLPVVLDEGMTALIVANTMYAVAVSWYWYITHLGYRSLPFLQSTEVFLFPVAAVAVLYVAMIVGYPFGLGWNAARVMTRFYFM